ncbi:MAG: NifB/NifX family molybdenum-iron cluster-binding protein [Acidobacteriota bacterium]
MLAVPVLRSRVAPVLNWCSRVIIISDADGDEAQVREIIVQANDPFELLRRLKALNVSTLICGALTQDIPGYARNLGIEIIHGVAGEVSEVVSAYRNRCLDKPRFRLPGCPGPCRCRGQAERSSSQKTCVCPGCGREVVPSAGTPRSRLRCPACERPMRRKPT